MQKIKIFPCPNVEVRINLTDEMIEDYKKCQKSKGDCDKCSWKDKRIHGIIICDMDKLEERMEMLINDSDS